MIALYGYVWYSLMRPDVLAWSEGMYPHSITIAIVTLLGVWRYIPNFQHFLKNPFVLSLVLLQIPLILSCVASPNPSLCWDIYFRYAKVMVMGLLIPLYVQTEAEFRKLMLVIVGCLGFVGFKYGIFGLRHGGIHISEGYGGFMSDNNTLAMALVMALPMIWYARGMVERQWIRAGMILVCFLTIAAIVMSHSRAAALTLVLVYLCIAARSKYKLLTLGVVLALSAPAVILVQDTFYKRMKTLENPDQEGSAHQRMAYARAAVNMWKDYPLFGVGFGTENWIRMSGPYLGHANLRKHVVHNNYLQMAVDSGTFALAILLVQLFGSIIWLGRSAGRMRRLFPGQGKEAIPIMMQVALIAYSFCSIFASRTDYDFYYYLIMCCGCWYIVEQTELLPFAAKQAAGEIKVREAAPAGLPVSTWQPVAMVGPARVLRDADVQLTGPIPKGWRRPFNSSRLEKNKPQTSRA